MPSADSKLLYGYSKAHTNKQNTSPSETEINFSRFNVVFGWTIDTMPDTVDGHVMT